MCRAHLSIVLSASFVSPVPFRSPLPDGGSDVGGVMVRVRRGTLPPIRSPSLPHSLTYIHTYPPANYNSP